MVGVAELPATFRLQAADLDLDVWAKLVWHYGEDAGVRFKRMETRELGSKQDLRGFCHFGAFDQTQD